MNRLLNLCIVIFLVSLSAMAFEWSDLDKWQETRTKEDVQRLMQVLVHDSDEARAYVARFVAIGDDALTIKGPQGITEYTFRFGSRQAPHHFSKFDASQGELGGLRIGFDANDQSYQPFAKEVVDMMSRRLAEKGAMIKETQKINPSPASAKRTICQELNTFHPDIVIAVRFDVPPYGSHSPCVHFCSGCFMKGELAVDTDTEGYAVRFRHRFAHALLSGSLDLSAELAARMAKEIRGILGNEMQAQACASNDYERYIRLVPMTESLRERCQTFLPEQDVKYLPDVLGRNTFITGTFAPAVVWTFAKHDIVKAKGAQAIAGAYVKAITDFVKAQRRLAVRDLL